jgi:hypothetical protein
VIAHFIITITTVFVVLINIITIILCTLEMIIGESCACVRSVWAGDLLVLKVLAFSWKSVCEYVFIELDAR